ncbi:MAG TPA: DUF1003 domain-containing protein [Anaerolineae bacterium]
MDTPNHTATHKPVALVEILHRRKPVRDVNAEVQDSLSGLDKLALFVTQHVGTPGFFLIILCWTILWLGWNSLAPPSQQFDPPTAFVLWLFMSNVIQILLMPLIMVGQNLLGRHNEIRAEHEYDLTVSSRNEIESILQNLEYQNAILISMVRKLGLTQQELDQAFHEHMSTLAATPQPKTEPAKPVPPPPSS